jgi:hypothetical protein
LPGGRRVAVFNGRQDLCDITHRVQDTAPQGDMPAGFQENSPKRVQRLGSAMAVRLPHQDCRTVASYVSIPRAGRS